MDHLFIQDYSPFFWAILGSNLFSTFKRIPNISLFFCLQNTLKVLFISVIYSKRLAAETSGLKVNNIDLQLFTIRLTGGRTDDMMSSSEDKLPPAKTFFIFEKRSKPQSLHVVLVCPTHRTFISHLKNLNLSITRLGSIRLKRNLTVHTKCKDWLISCA